MAINKVVYGNQTLIDLTTDTVASSDDILAGKVGHLRDGTVVTGTASGGDQHGTIWQDGEGYVHLDDESGIALESKSVTPSESQQVIEAGEGYYALDKVTVGAISTTYVGSGIARKSSSDLTVSGATVTAPAGYYSSSASKAVASGTAGTPTATKGTVSNHAVTVTPSVTNTTGYITGGTKTGTAVTVTASELVSGTYSVTSNGTKDVTNYASINVPAGTAGTPTATKSSVYNHAISVTPQVTNSEGYITGGTKTGTEVTVSASEVAFGATTITENGTYDVTNLASAIVNVPAGKLYTATVTGLGSSTIYVKYNNVVYNEPGSFTFSGGEQLDVMSSGRNGGNIIWNETNYDLTHSAFTLPYSDISVAISGSSTPTVNIQTAKLLITSNGIQSVSEYDRVDVSVEPQAKMDDPVRFFDYDGTLLYSYSASDFQSLTTMPSNPTHNGLTAQGWNWTLTNAKAQLTDMGACDIGQAYVTSDGKTRLYCRFEDGRLSPYLGLGVNGTIEVDWGDNSATSTLTGSSLTTAVHANHTYATSGDYVIAISVSSGSFSIFGVSNTSHVLKKDTSTTALINRVYTNAITKVELGNNVNLGNYAFNYCQSLESITIPSSRTLNGTYLFQYCYNLKHVTVTSGTTMASMNYAFGYCASLRSVSLPISVTSLPSNVFYYCHSLPRLILPKNLTTLSSSALTYCYALRSINIPNGVSSIGASALYYCYSLTSVKLSDATTTISSSAFYLCAGFSSITIPNSVTSIGNSVFQNCYGLGEIHFKPTTPPTVSNSSAWTNLQTDCKIYVPTGYLSAYTSATNYPSSSTYTYVEE